MRAELNFQTRRIPPWLKFAYTAFLCVLVPYYLHAYGPSNFLWFCDVALLFTLAAVWTEKPLLASIPAVGIVLPQLVWCADFLVRLTTGGHIVDLTEYMFNAEIPLFVRGLSLFHGWLPFLLLYLVWKLGYDRRAIWGQTLVAWVVLLLTFVFVTDPAGPAGNVNKIFGLTDGAIQTTVPPVAWLGVLMLGYPLGVYLPAHLLLKRLFPAGASAGCVTSSAAGVNRDRPPSTQDRDANHRPEPRRPVPSRSPR